MNNLYLVGMMGSGKSVTGKCLADALKLPFVDLDEMIQQRCSKSITEIFKEEGEDFFRDREAAVLKEVSAGTGQVVATGGGVVLRQENLVLMKRTGRIIYLEGSLECLWKRVGARKGRPLLDSKNPKASLQRILNERRGLYESAAVLTLPTDGLNAEQVARLIVGKLGGRK